MAARSQGAGHPGRLPRWRHRADSCDPRYVDDESAGRRTSRSAARARSFRTAVLLLIALVCWDRRVLGLWRRRSAQFFYGASAGVMLLFALGPVARVVRIAVPLSDAVFVADGTARRRRAASAGAVRHALRDVSRPGGGDRIQPVHAWRAPRSSSPQCSPRRSTSKAGSRGSPSWPFRRRSISNRCGPELPLLELPVAEGFSDSAAMLRATRHHHPLFHGTSGYSPPHYEVMLSRLQAVGSAHDRSASGVRAVPRLRESRRTTPSSARATSSISFLAPPSSAAARPARCTNCRARHLRCQRTRRPQNCRSRRFRCPSTRKWSPACAIGSCQPAGIRADRNCQAMKCP